MTPDKLSNDIDRIVTSAEAAFGSAVSKTQTLLFEKIQVLLNGLELNADGTIKQNQANRKTLLEVDKYFNQAFNESGYYQSLNTLSGSIGKITNSNVAYFAFVGDQFSTSAQYIKSLQSQTVSQIESLLANEGLEVALKRPIIDILNQNINTSAAFKDLQAQIREFILGSDTLEPTLARYSRQITTDTLFNYSRSLQEAISEQAGLQFYQYVGAKDRDSRPFCMARKGKFFHKSEIESWAKQSWQGKRRGTTSSTIFIYCGGYNCRDQLIAVSETVVPKSVKERVK